MSRLLCSPESPTWSELQHFLAKGSAQPALRHDPAALAQMRGMLREGEVLAADGSAVRIRADTLCLHGDRDDAAAFAKALRDELLAEGFVIAAPGAAA